MRIDGGAYPSRRGVFAMTALGAAALAFRPDRAAAAAYGAAAPADRLKAFMLMRAALDDRLVVGCLTGRYDGVVNGVPTPLYGVVSATFARYRRKADGGYEGASYESAYFTDLDTGKVLDRWRNPYTGATVAVPQTGFPPGRIVIGSDLSMTVPGTPPGMSFDHHVSAGTCSGDNFWLVEETKVSFQAPAPAKPTHYNETVTLHASLADLARPGAKRVPCQTSYVSVVTWHPWQQMGNQPGNLLGQGFGRYDVPMDQLPPAWIEAAAERHPALLKEPGSSIAALWATKA